jgi:glycosyltransferase involved in cell wall biosynthesis
MKIAIVVHGRFHAFDIAGALIGLGHEVTLYTNYPKNWPEGLGVPRQNVRSNVAHGIVSRVMAQANKVIGSQKAGEKFLHTWFGRWASRELSKSPVDMTHLFSGVGLEAILAGEKTGKAHTLMRGSSHIQKQREILDEEEVRSGHGIDKPSDWMIRREADEYVIADLIVCLSSFAYDSFKEKGFESARLLLNPLGVRESLFKASQEVLQKRRQRILSGKLQVLTAGTFSLRKGALDLVKLAEAMAGKVDFVFRGDVAKDAADLKEKAGGKIQFLPRVDQSRLAEDYARADLFLFPTLEDGYAAVLAQAAAAGLPILATHNCGAGDILNEGMDGWMVPIRKPEQIAARLVWCDGNRESFAKIADEAGKLKKIVDWQIHARRLAEAGADLLTRKQSA